MKIRIRGEERGGERKLGGKLRIHIEGREARKRDISKARGRERILSSWIGGRAKEFHVVFVRRIQAAKNNIGLAASGTDPVVRANTIARLHESDHEEIFLPRPWKGKEGRVMAGSRRWRKFLGHSSSVKLG